MGILTFCYVIFPNENVLLQFLRHHIIVAKRMQLHKAEIFENFEI